MSLHRLGQWLAQDDNALLAIIPLAPLLFAVVAIGFFGAPQ